MKKIFLTILILSSIKSLSYPGSKNTILSFVNFDDSKVYSNLARACKSKYDSQFGALGKLSEQLKPLSCSSYDTEDKYCSCVGAISETGLTLSTKEIKEAKERIRKASYNFQINNLKEKLKASEDFEKFMWDLDANGRRHFNFNSCFDNPVSALNGREESSEIGRAKLEIFQFLEGQSHGEAGNRPVDKREFKRLVQISSSDYQEDYTSGVVTVEEQFKILEASEDMPFITLFKDQELGLQSLAGKSGSIISQMIDKQLTKKCQNFQEMLKNELNQKFIEKIDVNVMMATGEKEKFPKDAYLDFLALGEDVNSLKTQSEIFNVSKLFCINKSKNKKVDLIAAETKGSKEEKEEMKRRLAQLDEAQNDYNENEETLKAARFYIDDTEAVIKRDEKVSDFLKFAIEAKDPLLIEQEFNKLSIDIKDALVEIDSFHLDTFTVVEGKAIDKVKDIYDTNKWKLETLKPYKDLILEKTNKRDELLSNISNRAKEVNDYTQLLINSYGYDEVNKMITKAYDDIKYDNHSDDIVNSFESYNNRVESNKQRSKKLFEGIKASKKKRETNQIKRSTYAKSFKVNKVEQSEEFKISNPFAQKKNDSQEQKSIFSENYLKKANVKKTAVSDQKEVEKQVKTDREIELEKQLKALESFISKREKEDSSESLKNDELADLKNKVELEKIKNQKLAIQKELDALKKAPLENTFQDTIQTKPAVVSAPVKRQAPASSNQVPVISSRGSSISTSEKPTTASNNDFSPINTPSVSPVVNTAAQSSSSPSTSSNKSSSEGKADTFTLSKNSSFELTNESENSNSVDSRVVKLDFDFNTISEANREDFLEGLFIEGEKTIVLELPDGEKLVVENKKEEGELTKPKEGEKRKPASVKEVKRERKILRYEDLKKILDDSNPVE